MSKVDVARRGPTRVWHCICGRDFGPLLGIATPRICPRCVMARHIRHAEAALGINQEDEAARFLPLVVAEDGGHFRKAAVISGWREAVGSRTATDVEELGITGHTARRAGCHLLARLGWARWQIQFMARHSTSQVDVYVGEAWNDQASAWAADMRRAPPC